MKVSAIIPFHGGIQFLHDCLESLADQDYKDMEAIIVCDNLKEDINGIIEKFRDKLCIKLFHTTAVHGVAAARNIGLDHAAGEYIYFLDSDDYIYDNAVEKLVLASEEDQADVVYGKKKGTWFKKSVFVGTYQAANETENEDEDSDSFENAELQSENGGEVEEESNLDENDDEGEEESELSEEERMLRRRASVKNRALRFLITRKKGIKSVSVLHILIKRSLIEEYEIRFHEDFTYYSDLSFIMQVLSYAETYAKDMKSIYVKRKHNDSINFPALSQIKDPEKFNEYVAAYYYTVGKLPEESDLKWRLDKKVINYYARGFAPRLRRSLNDEWREGRFEIMQKLVSTMDRDRIRKLRGYKKRIIKALIRGDIKKSIRIVNWNLGFKKFRRITKNRRALAKFLYIHRFLKMPLMNNWVLCESFFGKNYSDSPKYIYEYLSKNYPGKFKFIWVIDKRNTNIPYEHKKIKRFSFRYAYYLARCKYYVFNGRQPEWVRKREGNVFLETWHGTPLKKLVFDQDEVCGATPRYKAQVYKQSRAWDYLIAANQFSSDTFKRCFMFDKTMLDIGYPRNDILHAPNRDAIAEGLRRKLQIPQDKKTILYAPTWRDDEFYAKGEYKFALQMDLHRMKEELGSDYVVLLRTHYFIADALDVTGLEGFAYNLSKYDDISELYLISDVLITDYSSVFFDYANLKRPMLFFTYDLDKYRDVLRGFYIDIEKEVPGPLLFTTDEIINAVKNLEELTIEYKERYDIFYERFCGWEDGRASEKAAKAVFELDHTI